MSRNKEHRGAAFGGAPNGAAASRPPHWVCVLCFWSQIEFLFFGLKTVFFSFSMQNHTESSRNFIKKSILITYLLSNSFF